MSRRSGVLMAEHRFIVTSDAETTTRRVCALLEALGLCIDTAELGSVTAHRSSPNIGRPLSIKHMAQRIAVTFDRGLVEVAAELSPREKPSALVREVAVAIARTFERSLADPVPPQPDLSLLHMLRDMVEDDAQFRRRRWRRTQALWVGIGLGSFVLLITAIIALAAFL